jgi:hypothetical protein
MEMILQPQKLATGASIPTHARQKHVPDIEANGELQVTMMRNRDVTKSLLRGEALPGSTEEISADAGPPVRAVQKWIELVNTDMLGHEFVLLRSARIFPKRSELQPLLTKD